MFLSMGQKVRNNWTVAGRNDVHSLRQQQRNGRCDTLGAHNAFQMVIR